MKLYIGHVALWLLITTILRIIAVAKSGKSGDIFKPAYIVISMVFGLITFLIHWGLFL
jgi:hypothetical protein